MHVLLGKINFYTIALLFNTIMLIATPECFLDIRGTDGSTLKTVGSGVPFQIVVSINNATDSPQIEIDSAPFAVLRRVSVQTRIINGNTSISHIYNARIDGTGEYHIGPARVLISNIIYQTNACAIEVGNQEKVVGARFAMKIFCDDDLIYVGQETMLRMRIYSLTSAPEVESLHMSKIEGVVIGELREGTSGTEYIDKVKYRYKEFFAPISVQTTGKFLIPACSVDVRDDQSRRGGFGIFFSAIAPTKQVYSNSVNIEVCSLPLTDKMTSLIGEYQSVDTAINPSVVHLGQAVTYTLTLEGEGNGLKVQAPLLSNMPLSCKYYDSSVRAVSGGNGVVFEYIVQPCQVGTWEIPTQEIIYFDPTEKEYRTLFSPEIIITVLPIENQAEIKNNVQEQDISNKDCIVNCAQQFHPDLLSLYQTKAPSCMIPWAWYWFMVIIILFSFCGRLVYCIVIAYFHKNCIKYRSYFAFYCARKAIVASEKYNNVSNVYDIFVTLFSDWFMVEKSQVTESFIKEKLLHSGIFSENGLESWNRFWYKVVRQQYGAFSFEKNDKIIYTEARLWIIAFSKIGIS